MVVRHYSITQEEIGKVPPSLWYEYTLECDHSVYSKVRVNVPKTFMEHFIMCPQCQRDEKTKATKTITVWKAITGMKVADDAVVRDVLDGAKFILPRRILRTDGVSNDGNHIGSGNPFPYSSKNREY